MRTEENESSHPKEIQDVILAASLKLLGIRLLRIANSGLLKPSKDHDVGFITVVKESLPDSTIGIGGVVGSSSHLCIT